MPEDTAPEDKAPQDRVPGESAPGDRAAVDRAAVDRVAVDRVAVDRVAVDRVAVDRAAGRSGAEERVPGRSAAGQRGGHSGDAGPAQQVAAGRTPARHRVLRFAARHWLLGTVLVLAATLRLFTMLAYRPVEWFNDSYSYVDAAVQLIPEPIRPSGYPFFVAALEPLHRFAAVTFVQHILGLATGMAVYGVLRARGVRAWVATLAAVPVLFDAYELQLEHLIMADTLFMFLVTAAVVVLCLRNQPGWVAAAAAGLLLGLATIVRTDGRPLLVVVAICLIVRRAGWRPVVALAVTGLVPIAAYMGWYHSERGVYAITEGDGAFVYSRVMAFAECAKMRPPAGLRRLCDNSPPSQRPPSADYIWRANPLRTHARGNPWSPRASKVGREFAFLAVRRQPLDYLGATAADVARTFGWTRSTSFPDPATAAQYQFATTDTPLPSWAPMQSLHTYQAGDLTTRVFQPYASFLAGYQRFIYFRGTLLLLTLLAGAAWVVTGRRRGAPGLLPWCTAVALIIVPPATAGFTYRYVLTAVPCACLAAGLAGAGGRLRRVRSQYAPGTRSPADQPAGPVAPVAAELDDARPA